MSYAAESRKALKYSPILTNAALRRLAQPDADKRRQDLQRQLKSDSDNVEAADFVGVIYQRIQRISDIGFSNKAADERKAPLLVGLQ